MASLSPKSNDQTLRRRRFPDMILIPRILLTVFMLFPIVNGLLEDDSLHHLIEQSRRLEEFWSHSRNTSSPKQAARISNLSFGLVVSHHSEDLSWLTLLPTQNISIHICAHQGHKTAFEGVKLQENCYDPFNRGAESSSYLKYLLFNWLDLADWTIFVDGSPNSWHYKGTKQALIQCTIQTILEKSDVPAFFNINSVLLNSLSNPTYSHERMTTIWDSVVKPHLGIELPYGILTGGSAQFAISRERIHNTPIGLVRDLLLYTTGLKSWPGSDSWVDAKGYSYRPGGPADNWVGNTFFCEWFWHLFFGQPAHDLPLDVCATTVK